MEGNTIYLGETGKAVQEHELCTIIIRQISKGNEKVINNIISNHMDEVRTVSQGMISLLGGHVIGARVLNYTFYEVVSRLGYVQSLLSEPYASVSDKGMRL